MGVQKGASSKRELINTGTDKRYVRRDEKGSSASKAKFFAKEY